MTRTALQRFGKSRPATDAVVIEASGNGMAVSRVLSAFVKRVVIANPLQVKAIAHAHVESDKVDAGMLASVYAAGYRSEIRTPDAATERSRRLVARRYEIVGHRTRIKNDGHAILQAHLIRRCSHADQSPPAEILPTIAHPPGEQEELRQAATFLTLSTTYLRLAGAEPPDLG